MSTFEFKGEQFAYADEFPDFAYAEFCEALDDGLESDGRHATAVTLRLALGAVAEADQVRFRQACRKAKAKTEDYLKVFSNYMEQISERPTQQPTASSDGLDITEPKSESQPVDTGSSRPDLALALVRSA